MVTAPQIIATINPGKYYAVSDDKEKAAKELSDFKKLIKDKGFQAAAAKAKPKAEATHKITYDSATETLEPVYFWIVDLLQDDFRFQVDKIADSFSSSPGSGHFAEFGQRTSIMQQQATKLMGDVNNVLRGVLNLIYDLKDFKTRLQHYNDASSKDVHIKNAAILALKQIWMDKVDIQKGNSSIKAMALGQAGFQTLIDAFLSADTVEQAEKLDLNDRVKRILIPRIQDFKTWLEQSEIELRKRYNLEKNYLRAQVNNLKLYSRWAKPYLRAATQLEQKDQGRNPAMVKSFNTLWLELTLFAKNEVGPGAFIGSHDIPKDLAPLNIKKKYYECVLVDFVFRGIPQRLPQQGYVTGGRVEVTFRGYALNEDEVAKFYEELDKSDLGEVLGLIDGITEDSLGEMQKEINSFLEEKDEEEKKKEKKTESTGENPLLALIGYYEKPSEKKTDEEKPKEVVIRPETWGEKDYMRPLVAASAAEKAFKFYDIYKKAHSMPSYT